MFLGPMFLGPMFLGPMFSMAVFSLRIFRMLGFLLFQKAIHIVFVTLSILDAASSRLVARTLVHTFRAVRRTPHASIIEVVSRHILIRVMVFGRVIVVEC